METSDPVSSGTAEEQAVRVTLLKGPGAIGAVSMMQKSKAGRTRGKYEFHLADSIEEAAGELKKSKTDIVLMPIPDAAVLYQQSNRQVQICCINSVTPIYILEKGEEIGAPEDLKGRRVLALGKDTLPQYAMEFLMQKAGLTADDLTLNYADSLESAVRELASGGYDAVLMPQPFAGAVMKADPKFRIALDCAAIWEESHKGSKAVTGGVTVRAAFAAEQAEKLRLFLKEYAASAAFANSQVEETAGLCEAFGILEKGSAVQAVSDCGITCIVGNQMKTMTQEFLAAVKKVNPAAVGGALPEEQFYWTSFS